ncbi:hypothetical protein QUB05_23915 [Microcoleus sp. F10-C6]
MTARFLRWQKADIGKQVLEPIQAQADKQEKLDSRVDCVDRSVIRTR